ncbi:unnamed protein product [Caenorhabditis brenneri]
MDSRQSLSPVFDANYIFDSPSAVSTWNPNNFNTFYPTYPTHPTYRYNDNYLCLDYINQCKQFTLDSSTNSSPSPSSSSTSSPANPSESTESDELKDLKPKILRISCTTRKCSNCGSDESCKWRNITSKDGILCNACFIYRRKYKKNRPTVVAEAYKARRKIKKQQEKE